MKKFFKCFSILLAFCIIFPQFIACTQDARNQEIVAIYNLYAENIKKEGKTPLSYEEWMNSIKGEKGDKGDKGDNGLSVYELYLKYHPEYNKAEEEFLYDLINGNLINQPSTDTDPQNPEEDPPIETDPPVEIKIGVQDQSYGLDWLNATIAIYNEEHPETKVVIADSDVMYSETASAELKADTTKVDLIICAMINDIGEYVEKGRLVELSDVYASPYNDEETLEGALLEGAKIKCKHDGPDGALGYYAVPLDESLQSFIVNKTVVNFYEGQKSWGTRKKLAKVATVDDLVTWVSNIMSMSKQIPFTYLDGTGSGPVMGYTYPGMYMSYWEPMVSTWWAQYSGYEKYASFFELQGPEAYSDEGRLKALEAFTKLKLGTTALEGSAGFSHIDSQNAFVSGKAVLIPNGIWIENESRNVIQSWGAEIEMIGVPAIDSDHIISEGTGDNKRENYYYANVNYVAMIPAKAGEKIPAVKDFLSFMCSESEALRFTKTTGGVRSLYQGYTKELYGTMELTNFCEKGLKKRDKAVALIYDAPQDAEAKNWKILRRNYASKWCYDPHYSEIIQKQDALSYVKSVYDKQYTTALSKFDEWCKKAGV